jgi:hypothetical protein
MLRGVSVVFGLGHDFGVFSLKTLTLFYIE